MITKIGFKSTFLLILILFIGIVSYAPIAQAQYWVELPPYNTLWPLWSPALSPVDAITGEPVPIVSSLASSTILPVVPGLTWDPALPYPWLLYNTAASGLAYYDPFTGINLWPAPYLLDEAGAPAPISLPDNYAALSPVDYGAAAWILSNLALANNSFLLSPFGLLEVKPGWYLPPSINFLSPLDILGAELAAIPNIFDPVLLTQPAPIPIAPVPTVPLPIAPLPTAPLPTVPIQTLLAPTAPVPTAPIPLLPPPTVPTPAIPAPTPLAPTAPVPTLPLPITPLPTAPVPTIPLPTAPIPIVPVPTIPVTTIVPVIPPPTVTGVIIAPTATISGLFLFPF
ncbi:MAG: hypothetical protein ACMUIP_13520 [bacterium]